MVRAVLGCLVMIVMLGLLGMNPALFGVIFFVLIIWALCEGGSSGSSHSGSSGGYSSYSSGPSASERRARERRAEDWARSDERRRQSQAAFRESRSSMNNVMKRAADGGVNFGGSRNRSGGRSRPSSCSSGFGGGKSRGGGGGRSF